MTEEQVLDRKILLKKQLIVLVRKEIRQMQKTLNKTKRTEGRNRCPRSPGETTGTGPILLTSRHEVNI